MYIIKKKIKNSFLVRNNRFALTEFQITAYWLQNMGKINKS